MAVQGCSSGSEDIWQAVGFTQSEESVLQFMEKVYSYWRQHNYPNMHRETRWRVQLAKPATWFKHHSILVQSAETEEYFTLELVITRQGVVPETRSFDLSRHDHLNFTDLGEVTMSAVQLFDKALKCIEEFGNYDIMTNNCQDFCQV